MRYIWNSISTPLRNILAKEKSNRLPWVSYAKGIAIFLVVYRHALSGYESAGANIPEFLFMIQQAVYNFRMPLFFILAGLFVSKSLAKRNLKAFIIYKLKSIMYPYLVWSFLQVSMQLFLSEYANGDKTVLHYLYILYAPEKIDQFWFLYALFNVSILFAIFQSTFKPTTIQHVFIGLLFQLIATMSFAKSFGALFTDTLNYYIYLAIGNATSKYFLTLHKKPISFFINILLIVFPIFILSQWYWIEHPALRDKEPFIFSIIALVGSLFLFNISFVLGKFDVLRSLRIVGSHSLYIYIMHIIILAGMRFIVFNLLGVTNIYILLTVGLLAGVVLPIVFYNLTKDKLFFLYTILENEKRKLTIA